MNEEICGYFRDDGTPVNPNLMPSQSLCATCRKNDDSRYEIPCNITRLDQEEDIFICFAYESISGQGETGSILKTMNDYMDQKYGKSGEKRDKKE